MTPRIPERVLVVDGYGISITVERGHLRICDGVADERRERRLSRVESDTDRIVVLADTGLVSLDAIRWCADLGISVVQVDRRGRVLQSAFPPGRDEGRLRRAQALAPDRPVGVTATRSLLTAKLTGQADVAHRVLIDPAASDRVMELALQLDNVQDLTGMRSVEATAANAYFKAWEPHIHIRFAKADRGHVPDHWFTFGGRRPARRSASKFTAINPTSAILNYVYALAEVETRRSCIVMGLDPGLGILHTDRNNRDGLVFDLLEPVRPVVDEWVLNLIADRTFTRNDFHETREGVCRLLAPFTHELATTLPLWARAVAPYTEQLAHSLAASGRLPIRTSTPLTGSRSRAAAKGALAKAARLVPNPARTCGECGTVVGQRNKFCETCWEKVRPAHAAATGYGKAREALTASRAGGDDPTQSQQARDRRYKAVINTRRLDREWVAAHPETQPSREKYLREIQPKLADIRLSVLQKATGLSQGACSLIRSGKTVPHPRHWAPLDRCVAPDPSTERHVAVAPTAI